MFMTKRLEILENSLKKKKALFSEKLQNHIDTVKQANGQPLNDKRNGQATLNKWERQEQSLRNLDESIKKTENAIEKEKGKIIDVEGAKENFPQPIIDLLEEGKIKQWRKHPNIMFVEGVDKARLVYDPKKDLIMHRYSKSITDKDQWKLFAKTYNELSKQINQGNS
jgi:hypothetical protein